MESSARVIWFARESATACVKALLAMPADPAEAEVADTLRDVVAQAIGTVSNGGTFPDVTFAAPQIAAAQAPADAAGRTLTVEGKPACACAVVAELLPAATLTPPSDLRRLDAVLDVELPLTVRFGQVVMPLRALADLGPGSVVDMGRSPDEPVELLVGGRLIARGEVVVVSGNYGVRITELTGAQPGLRELEARAS
jgi:flagellar motor switch protein FliN